MPRLALIASIGTKGAEANLAQVTRSLERSKRPDADKQAAIALQKQIQKRRPDRHWLGRRRSRTFGGRPTHRGSRASWPSTRPGSCVTSSSRCSSSRASSTRRSHPSNADSLEQLASARRRGSVEVVRVPGVNHLLVPATTGEIDEYGTLPDRTVSAAVTGALADLAAEDAARRRSLIRHMWILHAADSEAGPITFRVSPGAMKTVGRAPRADFILERRWSRGCTAGSKPGLDNTGSRRSREHQRHLRQRQAHRARAADERRSAAHRPRRAEGRAGAERLRARVDRRNCRLGLQKRIRPPFLADRRRRAVSRIHPGVVAKRKQHGPDRRDERRVVAARQVGPPDRSGKQRVADEEVLAGLAASTRSAGTRRRDSGRACDAAWPRTRRTDDLAGRVELDRSAAAARPSGRTCRPISTARS